MSETIINSNSAAVSSAIVSSATPSSAGSENNASTGVQSGNISSLSDLKEQSPEVYSAMMQGIAMNICSRMAQQQAHLKQIQEEARRASEG
ncbi:MULTISPECIES: hypothetical protein [unclassified Neochlamydia]|uniref:hypothetical protein n=1 Tax=unclassified Neochlamydia TaxID=2643326 RepID=UPI0014073196|nr:MULTISPECIES: hypothetical protein [unclassified Neochlamydia]MBS4169879.1 Uncharacterized protein [Neochlamydia sp. AcF95]NGY95903.1 hypothetical protein [Neochlamydia sp. AcF84]